MKPDKAIEILSDLTHPSGFAISPDIKAAVMLGIEALKALDDCRKGDCTYHEELLPGETTDD